MNQIKGGFWVWIVCNLFTISLSAQTTQIGKVSGKIIDTKNHAIAYATVTLLRADSTVMNGDLTKEDGSFSIDATEKGIFTLRISAIGTNRQDVNGIEISDASPNKNLGKIKLKTASTNLKEVTVEGEKAVVQMSVDKKVFNVEKNITTAGGSATDVLQNVPSVSVDVDGNVSLRGKSGATILIDGKPSTLLGMDVATALQSLPASSIESVEVITNPSAKYDAQGPGGIINIVTKKDSKLGINGYITAGAGTRDKYNGNIGLNARKGKWNVFVNSSARFNSNYNRVTVNRAYPNGNNYYSYENSQRHFDGNFNSIGATYDFNKKNSITLTQNMNTHNFAYKDPSFDKTYVGSNETSPIAGHDRYSEASGGPVSYSTSFDYRRKFNKTGQELNVDATYSFSNTKREQLYRSNYDSMGIVLPYSPIIQNAPSTGSNNSFNAWADYTSPLLTENGKLGLGWKSQLYENIGRNAPTVDSGNTGVQHVDGSLMNNFDYDQQIHALYGNWSDQKGKFAYQLGLRYEHAQYHGVQHMATDTFFTKIFDNFFPSAYVSYQLPKDQSIYLNYSRRTNRPSNWDLMPYRDLSSPGYIVSGNPAIDPEFINNIEFSYNKQTKKGSNIIFGVYYQYSQNLISRIETYEPSAGLIFRRPVNMASGVTYGVEANARLQILPIWDLTLSANGFKNEISVGDTAYQRFLTNQGGFSWFSKFNSTLKLPASFSIQVNGNYESPKVVAQGTSQEVYWVDVAVKKSFWKNKASLTVNVSDVFNTRKYNSVYHTLYYDQTTYRDRETQVGNISFTYRFGKNDFGKNENGEEGGERKRGKRARGENKDNANPMKKEDRENNLKQGDEGGGNDQGDNKGDNKDSKGEKGSGTEKTPVKDTGKGTKN